MSALRSFFRPAGHFRGPGLFDVPLFLACTQIASLIMPFAVDDNLHPTRPGREVAEETGELVDLLLRTVGPPTVMLMVAAVLVLGAARDVFLGVIGLACGILLTALTVGTEGILTYLLLVVVTRVAASVLHEVLTFPLRLVAVVTVLIGVLAWVTLR